MDGFLREVGPEWGLIAFTVLAPASVGMAVLGLITEAPASLALGACALSALAMAASVGHLARPWRAPFSLSNWRHSWLSREILAAAAFWCCTLAWWLTSSTDAAPALNWVTAAAGALLLYIVGMAYQLPKQRAWSGPGSWVELAAGALGLGIIAGAWILAWSDRPAAGALLALPFVALALIGWVYVARSRRLATAGPDDRWAAVASSRWRGLARYQRASLLPLAVAATLSLVAALVGSPALWLWPIALLASLVGQSLCRALFYGSARTDRYAARLLPPFTSPGEIEPLRGHRRVRAPL